MSKNLNKFNANCFVIEMAVYKCVYQLISLFISISIFKVKLLQLCDLIH